MVFIPLDRDDIRHSTKTPNLNTEMVTKANYDRLLTNFVSKLCVDQFCLMLVTKLVLCVIDICGNINVMAG